MGGLNSHLISVCKVLISSPHLSSFRNIAYYLLFAFGLLNCKKQRMGRRSSLYFGMVLLVVEVVGVVGAMAKARVVVCSEGFEMVEAKAEEVLE